MGIVILVLCILIVIGVPISFSIMGSSIIYFLMNPNFPLMVLAQRVLNGVNSFPLLALPLFIVAGVLMDEGGAGLKLTGFANKLVRHVSAGTGIVTVVTSCFYGAVTGSGVAGTAAVGKMMGDNMLRQGYNKKFAAGLIAGSGVLGMVIPPSIPMVLYGNSAGVSISKMLIGGIGPGIFTGICLAILCKIICRVRGWDTAHEKRATASELGKAFLEALPALISPIIIIGGIMGGICTPTEAAVVAVVYSFGLGLAYGKLKLRRMPHILWNCAVSSAGIMFIIAGASAFSWIMANEGAAAAMTNFLLSITSSKIGFFILINILLLILGCFMETTAIILVLTPIIAPVAEQFGIDPIHFGVVVILNLAIGAVTPPLGVTLITSGKILGIKIEDTFPDSLYVILAMAAALIIVMLVPQIATFLPDLLIG